MSAQKPDVAVELMRLATAWALGVEQWDGPARVKNRAALEAHAKATADRITALEAQNAELLEVLREVDEKNTDALAAMSADGVTPPAWFIEQAEKIKAVIAKAERGVAQWQLKA